MWGHVIPSRKITALILGVSLLALGGCGTVSLGKPTVSVALATKMDLQSIVVATGTVEPSRTETITAQVAGMLLSVPVREGDQVKKGDTLFAVRGDPYLLAASESATRLRQHEQNLAQVLRKRETQAQTADAQLKAAQEKLRLAQAQLSDQEQKLVRELGAAQYSLDRARLDLRKAPTSELLLADVDRAEKVVANIMADIAWLTEADSPSRAQVQVAQAELELLQTTLKSGTVLNAEIIAAQSAVETAQQALAMAQQDVDKLAVRAPYDAVVLAVPVKAGVSVTAGVGVVTLAVLDPAVVKAKVAESDIGLVNLGQTVRVNFPNRSAPPRDGTVRRTLPQAVKDGSATVVPVDVEFSNNGLLFRSGMTADVRIEVGTRAGVLAVPESAVLVNGEEHDLYVSVDQVATRRSVSVGIVANGMWEITSGLEPGDKVILDHLDALANGTRITEVVRQP